MKGRKALRQDQQIFSVDSLLKQLLISHYMLRTEKGRKLLRFEQASEGRNSSDWDCSEQGQMEEVPAGDQKIDDLHHSLNRLRQFVEGLSVEEVTTVPQCVKEYCDSMPEFRVKSKEQVILMAQRRLNKMLRNRKIKRNWNNEDIILLVWLVCKETINVQLITLLRTCINKFIQSKQDWEFISQLISGSNWQKCKFKWLSLKKVKLITHKWSKIQSKLLADLISDHSKINWKLVSELLYQRNPNKNKVFRTPKQCREHWNCFLNPNIQKGPWTLQEDRRLLEYVLQLEGSKKWSQISKFMDGRTQNALKNRYNLLVNRQKKLSGHLTQKRLVKICLNRLMLEQGHQEDIQMHSHSDSQAEEQQEQIVQRQSNQAERRPIVPTVVQTTNIPGHLPFATGFENMIGYMSGAIGQQNPFYISFVFPNQFL